MKKDNVRIYTSPSMKEAGVAGSITVTVSNFESYPICDVRVSVEASKDVLEMNPKNRVKTAIESQRSHDFMFTVTPKTSKIGFAVTVRYKCNGSSRICTSDHIIEIST